MFQPPDDCQFIGPGIGRGSDPDIQTRSRGFQVSKVYSMLTHFPVRLPTASNHLWSELIRSRYSSLTASARRVSWTWAYSANDTETTWKTESLILSRHSPAPFRLEGLNRNCGYRKPGMRTRSSSPLQKENTMSFTASVSGEEPGYRPGRQPSS